jgi:hypothetical protein
MSEPAYTPRTEYQCDGSTTHYQGCQCHEARRAAELADLRRKLEVAEDALLKADRYFKAKGGEYACDVSLSEKSAAYGVDRALAELRDGKADK